MLTSARNDDGWLLLKCERQSQGTSRLPIQRGANCLLNDNPDFLIKAPGTPNSRDAGSHLRGTDVALDLELAAQAVHNDVQVQLAHALCRQHEPGLETCFNIAYHKLSWPSLLHASNTPSCKLCMVDCMPQNASARAERHVLIVLRMFRIRPMQALHGTFQQTRDLADMPLREQTSAALHHCAVLPCTVVIEPIVTAVERLDSVTGMG